MSPSVTVADRIYTLESIQELMTQANTHPEESARAAATFEIASLSLFSQLTQARALEAIERHLAPVVTRTDLSFTPPADEPTHTVGRTKEQDLLAAAHDHSLLNRLRVSVIEQGKPAIFNSVKHGVLKVFYEGAEEPEWKYTQDGHLISEDKMIALLDAASPPSDA